MMGGSKDLKMNEIDVIEIRYDVATVLLKDRDKVAAELLYRYGLNASSFSQTPEWWGFASKNYSYIIDSKSKAKNNEFWKMKVSKSSKYRLRIMDRDGEALLHNNGQVDLDLP